MREDSKCDVIVNNNAETFNAYVVHARTKHLIDVLEDIRMALMERIVVKRSIMEASEDDIEDLCPKIRSKLEKEKEEARNYFPVPAGNKVFWVTQQCLFYQTCSPFGTDLDFGLSFSSFSSKSHFLL